MTDPIHFHRGHFVFTPISLYEMCCQYSSRSSTVRCTLLSREILHKIHQFIIILSYFWLDGENEIYYYKYFVLLAVIMNYYMLFNILHQVERLWEIMIMVSCENEMKQNDWY